MFAVPWGKVVDIVNFEGEERKGGKKLVGLSAEHLGLRKRGRGPESVALFSFKSELN